LLRRRNRLTRLDRRHRHLLSAHGQVSRPRLYRRLGWRGTTRSRVVPGDPREPHHDDPGTGVKRGARRSVTDARHPRRRDDDVVTDLVEYLIVAVADRDALAGVVPALAELVETATVRILDVVALVREEDGTITVLELEEIGSPAVLDALG